MSDRLAMSSEVTDALVAKVRDAIVSRFNTWEQARAAIAVVTEARSDDGLVEVTLQSVRTWIKGLPHDMESRPEVLRDIDAALSAKDRP